MMYHILSSWSTIAFSFALILVLSCTMLILPTLINQFIFSRGHRYGPSFMQYIRERCPSWQPLIDDIVKKLLDNEKKVTWIIVFISIFVSELYWTSKLWIFLLGLFGFSARRFFWTHIAVLTISSMILASLWSLLTNVGVNDFWKWDKDNQTIITLNTKGLHTGITPWQITEKNIITTTKEGGASGFRTNILKTAIDNPFWAHRRYLEQLYSVYTAPCLFP